MDEDIYRERQDEKFVEHEAKCRQCGLCCGAFGNDPCSNLMKAEDGRHICIVYNVRLGPQKSLSGNIFTCVTIRDVQTFGIAYPGCAYNR